MTSKKFYKEKQLSANEVKESFFFLKTNKQTAKDASLSVLSRSRLEGGLQSVMHIQEERSRGTPEGRTSSLKSVANEDGLNSDCLEGDSKAPGVLQLLAR